MLPFSTLIAAPLAAMPALGEPSTFSVVAVVSGAFVVLAVIALGMRRLRLTSRLRPVHGVVGGVVTGLVVVGALTVSMALGAAPTATAEQQPDVPGSHPVDTSDITDPATDIQLPTLSFED